MDEADSVHRSAGAIDETGETLEPQPTLSLHADETPSLEPICRVLRVLVAGIARRRLPTCPTIARTAGPGP